jgi:hypothetical protein
MASMPYEDPSDVAGACAFADAPPANDPADAATTGPGRWVAVAAYTHPIAAHIARLKLESDGFRCYLDNEMFVTTAWLYSIATGGVKLMVREPDVEAARESLREKVPHEPDRRVAPANAPAAPAGDDVVCRHCGSKNVAPDRPWKRLCVACLTMIAVDGVGLALMGPLMIGVALRSLVALPWKCGSCGHYWWAHVGHKGFDVVHRPAGAPAAPVPVLVLTPPPATGR